ncbi:MAG: bacteriohemerythrin [Methylomonas sp.]|jgi:predicted signal transduction protein with EAL and GGDEF domain/hemerythrin|uniref:bacteriohemerythrin n=1 Tax=Methylomonas sp. TaxID=418 RepID=UPI0025D71C8D|nr:bacteriohemerythrin [Methylomonas sp.]MCK9605035.1 bacteriohemerythrin [Methylomonas sp.]
MNSIDIFPWDDNFNTGIRKIDEQHRSLANLLNRLASQIAFTPDNNLISQILNELTDYAVYHFQSEEEIWATYLAHDDLEIEHKARHQRFIDTVQQLKAEQCHRPIAEITNEVLGFLARWLVAHIFETDREMAYIVLALQFGLNLEQAKQRAANQMAGTTRALIDVILSIYKSLSTNTLRLMREIDENKRIQAREKSRSLILELMATGTALPEILAAIVRSVEQEKPDMLCSILLLDNEGKHLLHGAAPSLPEFYNSAISGTAIGPGIGSCATAAFSGQRVIVEDIQSHPYWANYKALAGQAGLAACWSEPILSANGNVLGTFAIYHHQTHLPESGDIVLIEQIAHLTSIAIENYQTSQALKTSQSRLSTILDNVNACIYLKDTEGRYQFVNQRVLDLWGTTLDKVLGQGDEQFFDPQTTATIRENDHLVLVEGKTLQREEINVVAATGCTTTYWTTKLPLFRPDGEIYALCGISTDISERKQAEQALLTSELFSKAIIDAVSAHICVLDKAGKILAVNQAWIDFYMENQPENRDYGVGTNYLTLCDSVTDADCATVAKLMSANIRKVVRGDIKEFVLEYPCHSSNEQRWFIARVTRFQGDSGNVVIAHENITQRKQAEEKLQLAANVFTHAREGILITDAAGSIIDVNDTFTHITGYSREEILGKNPNILSSGRQGQEFYAAMWRDLASIGYWSGEIWNRRKNGEMYAEMLTISTVRDASGHAQNYVGLFIDITSMKEYQQQLEHIAHFDVLTNLPNRVLLADRLQQAMLQTQRHKHSLAVVYLDLDGFKAVNDSYDHETGDELLVAISKRMKEALREGDTLARIGGDEFVAVLSDLERMTDCEPILERFLQATANPVMIGQNALQVSASIGVTFYPQDNVDADQLMRHADQAMYTAKQAGKNRYHLFDVQQDAAIKTQRENLEGIRQALIKNEFVLYYQPKVNMQTGDIIGAEALIRWQHPQRGILAPGDFLPIIENHPLSVDLGEWVIDTALTQMSIWNASGLNIPVSVNVGARQLQQRHFAIQLSTLLLKHPNVKPNFLELEILETSALADIAEVSAIMYACREIGVRFALDDFGTGYSSLTYLRRLPADMLKIDQSFVRDMLVDPDDLAIVNGVIGLAAAFNRQVIAEGVETLAHGKRLLSMGCALAQGYGIARPMPAAEIPSWRPDKAWMA